MLAGSKLTMLPTMSQAAKQVVEIVGSIGESKK